MMPAILVSTVLGLIRSMEAFEIELLLGVPIGLFVYSTKIRDLVAYEPPEYAPATALGSIFLLLLLIMVALQRSYLGQRLYRTVTGRGFSTNPTSLGRWRWPIFSAVALIAFTVTVVPLMVLLMGTRGCATARGKAILDSTAVILGDSGDLDGPGACCNCSKRRGFSCLVRLGLLADDRAVHQSNAVRRSDR